MRTLGVSREWAQSGGEEPEPRCGHSLKLRREQPTAREKRAKARTEECLHSESSTSQLQSKSPVTGKEAGGLGRARKRGSQRDRGLLRDAMTQEV